LCDNRRWVLKGCGTRRGWENRPLESVPSSRSIECLCSRRLCPAFFNTEARLQCPTTDGGKGRGGPATRGRVGRSSTAQVIGSVGRQNFGGIASGPDGCCGHHPGRGKPFPARCQQRALRRFRKSRTKSFIHLKIYAVSGGKCPPSDVWAPSRRSARVNARAVEEREAEYDLRCAREDR